MTKVETEKLGYAHCQLGTEHRRRPKQQPVLGLSLDNKIELITANNDDMALVQPMP
ncbi:MAG: hypothetical protein ACLUGJ_01330 [Blautia wexlerae]